MAGIIDDLAALTTDIGDLHILPGNPRRGDVAAVARSLEKFGQRKPIVARRSDGTVIAGNHTLLAARSLGWETLAVAWVDDDDATAKAFALADNRTAELGGYDETDLAAMLAEVQGEDPALLAATGWSGAELEALLGQLDAENGAGGPGAPPRMGINLVERFGVPPFTVLDTRQGYWRDRKRSWLALGIRSEEGRGTAGTFDTARRTDAVYYDKKNAAEQHLGRELSIAEFERDHYEIPRWRQPPGDGIVFHGMQRRDPQYYPKKTKVEQDLGRQITDAEFEADHYEPPDSALLTGTSVFDPVLCEIAYRWYSPTGGTVIDPFAGGSVRGIVAAVLGRRYYGGELRPEQVAANRRQWEEIGPLLSSAEPEDLVTDPAALTPIQSHGGHAVKRDDLLRLAGGCGGKARTCWTLARTATGGLVTAGSRQSPQASIVAGAATAVGLPCRVHVPAASGGLTPELAAAAAYGAEIIEHRPGYNTVIVARARDDARDRGWTEIPFGMQCSAAVEATAAQVANLPGDIRRIVIPVGSGMSLAGVLTGLHRSGRDVPVVGVCVGADPTERLDAHAPRGWRERVTLVRSEQDYHDHAPVTSLGDLRLDPVYEAKCLAFLEPGDLLWVVGIRQSEATPMAAPPPVWAEGDSRTLRANLGDACPATADLLFTCPPYADLEVYSDDPADLSTLSYDQFLLGYRDCLAEAVALLAEDSFAVIVVGEVREKRGHGAYRGFVPDTISTMESLGLAYYGEHILINMVGSAAIAANKQFVASRKAVRLHQTVLVFVKGDARRAAQRSGIDPTRDLPDPDETAVGESITDPA